MPNKPTSTPGPPTYLAILLGSGESARTVNLPVFPPFVADPVFKKVALRTALSSLDHHAADVPSRSIFDALSTVVPQDLSAIDHESLLICDSIRDAFIRPGHPAVTHTATDFLNPRGNPLSVSADLPSREKNAKDKNKCIHFVQISATASDLSTIHPSLDSIGPITATYTLKLPLTLRSASAAAIAIGSTNLNPPASPTTTTSPTIPSSMTSCLSSTATTEFPNYYGTFDFLDNVISFNQHFGAGRPAIVTLTSSLSPIPSITYPAYADTLPHLSRLCYFACFSHLLELDYVGATISNDSATQAIFHMLRSLTATRHDPVTRKKTYHSPSNMFQSFMSLAPTLDSSSAASIASWPGSLAQQYLTNLAPEIQQRLYKGRSVYKLTDHSKLPSLSYQLHELRKLSTAAQDVYDDQAEMRLMCRQQVSSYVAHLPPTPLLSPGPPPASKPPLPTYPSTPLPAQPTASPVTPPTPPPKTLISPAESALQSYQPSTSDDRPIDPYSDTQFQSQFSRSFRGCFRCGIQHGKNHDGSREECPKRQDPSTKPLFFQEFFAHHPDKRRFYDNGDDVVRDAHGRIKYPPPSTPDSTLTSPRPHVHFSDTDRAPKVARTLLELVRSLHIRPATPVRPIPVAISSRLPTIDLHLGLANDPSSTTILTTLLDTCAGLNSGSYAFHKTLAILHPRCVAEFVEFDDLLNPFEPVRLTGAITDPDSYDPESLHGSLRAVITYHLPYTFVDGSPVKLSIALGTDVSVNTILGWPFTTSVRGLIDCGSHTFLARDLDNTTFDITPAVPLLTDSVPTHTTRASVKPQQPRGIDNRPAWLTHPTVTPLPAAPINPPPTTAALHAAAAATPLAPLDSTLTAFISQHAPDFYHAP
jgi:hypothetical protein